MNLRNKIHKDFKRSETHFRNSFIDIRSSHCKDGGLSARKQAFKDMMEDIKIRGYLVNMEKEILFLIDEIPPIVILTDKL